MATGKTRTVDVLRKTGPLTILAGTTAPDGIEALRFQVPASTDGEIIGIGWDVTPAGGAAFIRFRVMDEQASVPDWHDCISQAGTLTFPTAASVPVERGHLVRVMVFNDDPVNSYQVNPRMRVELSS